MLMEKNMHFRSDYERLQEEKEALEERARKLEILSRKMNPNETNEG